MMREFSEAAVLLLTDKQCGRTPSSLGDDELCLVQPLVGSCSHYVWT